MSDEKQNKLRQRNLLRNVHEHYNEGKYDDALQDITTLKQTGTLNTVDQINLGGSLINIGTNLNKIEIIRDGINSLEAVTLKDGEASQGSYLHYCIGNGYYTLFQLIELKTAHSSENLQKAKKHYRTASELSHGNSELAKMILVNLGNVFDCLGRSAEALECYDRCLNIDQEFGMALGNKGMALRIFADISGEYRTMMYIAAYQCLKKALEDNRVLSIGGLQAKYVFEKQLEAIQGTAKDLDVFKQSIEHPKYKTTGMSDFEKYYLEFCTQYELFLNFHIHETECEAAICDPINIILVTSIDENESFYHLVKYTNQIKQDYAVARLLLVQSQFKQDDLTKISFRTSLIYTVDYARYDLYIGLLRSSFEAAFNILDKIALFLNEYLGVNLEEKKVHFYKDGVSFWNNRVVKQVLEDDSSLPLHGLHDIFLDFERKYYQDLKELRNALTHKNLVVYDSIVVNVAKDRRPKEIDDNVLFDETIRLFRLVRAAITYLVQYVNLKENKKNTGTGLSPLSMYVDTTQIHLIGDEPKR